MGRDAERGLLARERRELADLDRVAALFVATVEQQENWRESQCDELKAASCHNRFELSASGRGLRPRTA
jgi:hypothetical protein